MKKEPQDLALNQALDGSEPAAPAQTPATSDKGETTAPPKKKLFTIEIPNDLHHRMRRQAIINGTSMSADIRRMLTDAYADPTKRPTDVPRYPELTNGKRISIEMSVQLHTAIKLNALDNGTTMTNEIRYLLEQANPEHT
jgi:plasmid stability protein